MQMSRIESVAFRGINVTPRTNWCFLEVRTADGLEGIGECTLANHEAVLAAEAERLAATATGEDARHRNRLARLIPHAPGGLVAATVLSAFEQALADLAANRCTSSWAVRCATPSGSTRTSTAVPLRAARRDSPPPRGAPSLRVSAR
jgi:L-alanine-DL-glutamate epimerase-like enolase superfamily enzyme